MMNIDDTVRDVDQIYKYKWAVLPAKQLHTIGRKHTWRPDLRSRQSTGRNLISSRVYLSIFPGTMYEYSSYKDDVQVLSCPGSKKT